MKLLLSASDSKNTVFKDSDILLAINQLKTKKAAGLDSLCAEHVKYAHGMLRSHLATLFTACCKHGFIPNNLCSGRITPVPKNECLNLKIYLLLIHYSLVYLKAVGVIMLYLFCAVVDYFTEFGSNVYLASLDLSKAFDRVNHSILLLKVNFLVDIILMLNYWFQHLCAAVEWFGILSDVFYNKE